MTCIQCGQERGCPKHVQEKSSAIEEKDGTIQGSAGNSEQGRRTANVMAEHELILVRSHLSTQFINGLENGSRIERPWRHRQREG